MCVWMLWMNYHLVVQPKVSLIFVSESNRRRHTMRRPIVEHKSVCWISCFRYIKPISLIQLKKTQKCKKSKDENPPVSTTLLRLLTRRKQIASPICLQVQFKAWVTLARIWGDASAIDASIVVFGFWITNWVTNVRLAFIVAESVTRVAFTRVWIDANAMNALNAAVWLTQWLVAFAQFESVDADACLVQTNAIDAVATLDIGAVAPGRIIDTRVVRRCTNTIRILFESFVA